LIRVQANGGSGSEAGELARDLRDVSSGDPREADRRGPGARVSLVKSLVEMNGGPRSGQERRAGPEAQSS